MSTSKVDLAGGLERSASSSEPRGARRRWWSVVTALLVAAIFAQAVFAGLMLSGVEWARAAHVTTAFALFAATLVAGLVAIVTLRRIPHGAKLALALLLLALVISLQTAVGKSVVEGANLMWLHVPLGVALVGFAAQAASLARRLGGA
jgi:uncharacterized membrane protein YhaH (DUF805 family)